MPSAVQISTPCAAAAAGERCQAVRERRRPLRQEQQRQHARQRGPEARHRPIR